MGHHAGEEINPEHASRLDRAARRRLRLQERHVESGTADEEIPVVASSMSKIAVGGIVFSALLTGLVGGAFLENIYDLLR